MEAELKALEQKIGELVDLCHRLRADNQQLRQELATSVNENKRLNEKIADASGRLEGLLRQIPEEQA